MELKKKEFSFHLVLGTLLYIIYIALIPGMEGIVFRKDSKNKTFISYGSILSMLSQPFVNKNFWNLDMLDINYLIFLIIYFILIYLGLKYVV